MKTWFKCTNQYHTRTTGKMREQSKMSWVWGRNTHERSERDSTSPLPKKEGWGEWSPPNIKTSITIFTPTSILTWYLLTRTNATGKNTAWKKFSTFSKRIFLIYKTKYIYHVLCEEIYIFSYCNEEKVWSKLFYKICENDILITYKQQILNNKHANNAIVRKGSELWKEEELGRCISLTMNIPNYSY